MGSTYCRNWTTQAKVVEALNRDYKPLDHEVVGGVWWAVVEGTEHKIILCAPILPGGYMGPMSEGMHPYYYGCPQRLLDAAPVANAKWRQINNHPHGDSTHETE